MSNVEYIDALEKAFAAILTVSKANGLDLGTLLEEFRARKVKQIKNASIIVCKTAMEEAAQEYLNRQVAKN